MRVFTQFAGSCLVLAMLTQGVLARPSLRSEVEIFRHDSTLADLTESLEHWLSGRQGIKRFRAQLKVKEKALGSYRHLPTELGRSVTNLEKASVRSLLSFSKLAKAKPEQQKMMLRELAGLTHRRTLLLLEYRALSYENRPDSSGDGGFGAWERQWIPIWRAEAKLTRDLQALALGTSEVSKEDKRHVLRRLLKLRQAAMQVRTPSQFQGLQELSLRRLTVLSRSAEQLLRGNFRKSQSAVTKLRRLSQKLNSVTKEFREERLARLRKK